MFVMEDLSKQEREERRSLVNVMKKARSEGKRAFIRYSDGKLIINGKVHVSPSEADLSPDTPSTPSHE